MKCSSEASQTLEHFIIRQLTQTPVTSLASSLFGQLIITNTAKRYHSLQGEAREHCRIPTSFPRELRLFSTLKHDDSVCREEMAQSDSKEDVFGHPEQTLCPWRHLKSFPGTYWQEPLEHARLDKRLLTLGPWTLLQSWGLNSKVVILNRKNYSSIFPNLHWSLAYLLIMNVGDKSKWCTRGLQ